MKRKKMDELLSDRRNCALTHITISATFCPSISDARTESVTRMAVLKPQKAPAQRQNVTKIWSQYIL